MGKKNYNKEIKFLFMKLITLIISILIFTGCKKSVQPIESYLRMTIDGARIECDQHIQASSNAGVSIQLLSISGNWTTNSLESGAIEIELYNFNNTTGERQFSSPGGGFLWFYHKNASGGVLTDTYSADGTGGSTGKINITEVSDRIIKGTFEFIALMYTGPGTVQTKTITNGEFYIKRI